MNEIKFNELRDKMLEMEDGKHEVNAADMNQILSNLCKLVQGPDGEAIIQLLQTHKGRV